MKCPECREEFVDQGKTDVDYTSAAGLDPNEYKIILKELQTLSCSCGRTHSYPSVNRLHRLLASAVLDNPARKSGAEFLRKNFLVEATDGPTIEINLRCHGSGGDDSFWWEQD